MEVFNATRHIECDRCADQYYYDRTPAEECERCGGKREDGDRYLECSISVTTEDMDPKNRPLLTCHIVMNQPSWKKVVDGERILFDGVTYTVSRVSFDFTFTDDKHDKHVTQCLTDDSDITVFEPHLRCLDYLFEHSIEVIRVTKRDLLLSQRAKGMKKVIDVSRVIHECETSIIKCLIKPNLRWVQPIARTLAKVFYKIHIEPLLPKLSETQKACPHVQV
jgi:ribosomal protein L37E